MNTNTKVQIVEYISKNEKVRPAELLKILGISQVMVQKHLKELCLQGLLQKVGVPPLVFYKLAAVNEPSFKPEISSKSISYLEKHYLYITPDGFEVAGAEGFYLWLSKTSQMKQAQFLADEYVKIHEEAETFRNSIGYIEGTQKFNNTFNRNYLDHVYYQDFYSLPKFGRTALGHKILLAKQAQNKALIHKIAGASSKLINKIIVENEINALAWTPHSIPRAVPFLKELRTAINLTVPELSLVKAYSGNIPVAQKSLSKLEERIENARSTIFVKTINDLHTKILIIDDAVGSGATLNEIAAKLKKYPFVKKVIGFAFVGSFKGFEVLKEV